MRRSRSALAASILNGHLLNSGSEPGPQSGEEPADPEPDVRVRKKTAAPRLTDNTTSHPHSPTEHGA